MKISVTAEHIANASVFPCSSPVALAAGDGAIANHVAVYIKGKRYELPEVAINNEKAFDYGMNSKKDQDQGIYLKLLEPYEFELCE